jgi:dephospho-CoA kinase
MSREVIGIVGTIGAGKDTVGDHVAQKLDIPTFQISSPLKEICDQEGIEPTRDNLITLGTRLANMYNDGYLAEYILTKAPESFVVTGMRQLGQIAVLKSVSNLKLISIDANPELRFERANKNNKLGEAKTLEEFIVKEQAENSAPNAQRLFECMSLAEYHIINEGSKEELYAQLDHLFNNKS